jgi:hypothetical protein
VRIRLSSKPYNHIARAKPCQPAHPTAFPRVFHMRNLFGTGDSVSSTGFAEEGRLWKRIPSGLRQPSNPQGALAPACVLQKRATIWPSALDLQRHRYSGACRSGRQKIEKRSYVWRFLALKVPFRNRRRLRLRFPNQVPWPGRLEGLTPSHLFRCRTRDESCKQYTRLATHTLLSVNCLYQMN